MAASQKTSVDIFIFIATSAALITAAAIASVVKKRIEAAINKQIDSKIGLALRSKEAISLLSSFLLCLFFAVIINDSLSQVATTRSAIKATVGIVAISILSPLIIIEQQVSLLTNHSSGRRRAASRA